jgi:hypothetical protein
VAPISPQIVRFNFAIVWAAYYLAESENQNSNLAVASNLMGARLSVTESFALYWLHAQIHILNNIPCTLSVSISFFSGGFWRTSSFRLWASISVRHHHQRERVLIASGGKLLQQFV